MSARRMGEREPPRGKLIVICPDLRAFAHALGGEILGEWLYCPGPGRSPYDRSLAVCINPMSPSGFTIVAHGRDDLRDCLDHVRRKLGPAWRAP